MLVTPQGESRAPLRQPPHPLSPRASLVTRQEMCMQVLTEEVLLKVHLNQINELKGDLKAVRERLKELSEATGAEPSGMFNMECFNYR